MLKHIIIAAFFLINGALAINPVKAEIAVIVHPNAAFELNEDEIIRIFLGKDQFFPDGSKVKAVEFDNNNKIFSEFCDKVVGQSTQQYRAYWSRMIFTGKAPPMAIGRSPREVIELVASDPQYIGYVPAGSIDNSVKVVKKF